MEPAQIVRTGSGQNGPALGSELLSSRSSAPPVGQLWRENVRARLGPFHSNWLFGRLEQTKGERPKKGTSFAINFETENRC